MPVLQRRSSVFLKKALFSEEKREKKERANRRSKEKRVAKWDDVGVKYPRKQLQRNGWHSLNGQWKFAFDHEKKFHQPSEVPSWDLSIQVPFAPESNASGVADTDYHRRCWYQKDVEIEKPAQGRMILHFGAVDYEARVWVNGQFIGKHQGGHTSFSFDITDALSEQDIQQITVCADDDPLDLTKPRGKQDWQPKPHSIWYPRTTGIWQTVWIEKVPSTYIWRVRWTPAVERWEIGFETHLGGADADQMRLQVVLSCDGKVLADDTYEVINQEVHRRIVLSDPGIDDYRNELLWSPEKPTLIQATLRLFCRGEMLDEISSYTALRTFSVNRGRFLLNGRPYYMRLVLDQGYWPETLMTAPSTEALRKDIEIAKEAGFNGARKHQKIEDPDYLYWADTLGFLVWEEMPSCYRFTHDSVDRLMREWTEALERDMNHPCIAVWVPFNESWGVPDLADKAAHQSCVQAMYHLTKTLDPTRPVIGNDGWESIATDILGIHDYDDQPERLLKKYGRERLGPETLDRYRPGGRVLTVEGYPHSGQPVMLTEFGGITCIQMTPGDDRQIWGYSVCKTPEEFRQRYEELLGSIHQIECLAGFCYTQLVDTFQEANGLFRDDRSPKFPLSSMIRATRGIGNLRGELSTVPQPPPLPDLEMP